MVGIIGHYLVVHEVGNPVLGFKLGPGAGGLADNAGLVEAEDAEYGGVREVGDHGVGFGGGGGHGGGETDGLVAAEINPGVFLMGNDFVLAAHGEPSKHHERQNNHSEPFLCHSEQSEESPICRCLFHSLVPTRAVRPGWIKRELVY